MRKTITTVAAVGGLAAVALTAAVSADAATSTQWDQLAQCESGGNWSISTGNGFYGGLQFTDSTWLGYGGGAFASTANKASREQQITVAAKVAAAQGWSAWPVCSGKAGLSGASVSSPVMARAGSTVSRSTTRQPLATNPAKGGSIGKGKHVVQAGETLSSIAQANHLGGWQQLFAANRNEIKNPNVLHVGEVLTLA
jgi:resuscitation-promoting factor RpfA